MKLFAILVAILAGAASYPAVKTWTLSQLSVAIEAKKHPELMPYLEDALNKIMETLFSGNDLDLIQVVIPSPTGSATWTATELKNAVEDHSINEEYRTAILQAHGILKQKQANGEEVDSVEVVIPAMDISVWTSSDLNDALNSTNIEPKLIPYLEKARNSLILSEEDGNGKASIGIVTPVGYIPHKADFEFIPKAPKYYNTKKTKKGI